MCVGDASREVENMRVRRHGRSSARTGQATLAQCEEVNVCGATRRTILERLTSNLLANAAQPHVGDGRTDQKKEASGENEKPAESDPDSRAQPVRPSCTHRENASVQKDHNDRYRERKAEDAVHPVCASVRVSTC